MDHDGNESGIDIKDVGVRNGLTVFYCLGVADQPDETFVVHAQFGGHKCPGDIVKDVLSGHYLAFFEQFFGNLEFFGRSHLLQIWNNIRKINQIGPFCP
jgi:hypothetical protein